ncbi:MAG TPA: DnaA regulatory inactivator Hda [Usitatibacter sp.]|nr:DnaA regulatory inactivator Hda [Usitatibacter sp.]
MRQLLLDFTQAPAPTFANFVHGGNAELFQVLESAARAELSERVVYMWGESGAGKTHLAMAFAQAASASARENWRVVDPVERLSEADQIALFNDFNERAFDFLLVTASSAPRDVPIRRDLSTRLATGLTYRVLPLTDGEKRAALAAHAKTRGFSLSEEVSGYLLTHARRDMGSLMAALDTLDRYSLETGRPITVPLLKAAAPSPLGEGRGEGR